MYSLTFVSLCRRTVNVTDTYFLQILGCRRFWKQATHSCDPKIFFLNVTESGDRQTKVIRKDFANCVGKGH